MESKSDEMIGIIFLDLFIFYPQFSNLESFGKMFVKQEI